MSSQTVEFQALFDKADEAGRAAAQACVPTPMTVVDGSQSWTVSDGLCGFAWIVISPGNCRFANWLKKNNLGKYGEYERGVVIWVSDYNQSIAKKEAYAWAFADVIRNAGIRCSACSRLD